MHSRRMDRLEPVIVSDDNRNGALPTATRPRRDTFERRMAIDVSVVRDLDALRALEAEWRTLAGTRPALCSAAPTG